MKKFFLLLLTIATLFASCQSKEEKAAELIREELSKTLYDFDSYNPIETTVKEAKASAFNDSTCWKKGALLAYGMQQMLDNANKYEEAKEHMDIWGRPTCYSSSYSDNQYYKYKKEYEEALENTQKAHKVCKKIAMELKEYVESIDTTQVIGWEVSHRFRCKTRGGNSAIGDYRYIIDKDFKTIIIREDKDDEDDKHRREAIISVLSDFWEELDK